MADRPMSVGEGIAMAVGIFCLSLTNPLFWCGLLALGLLFD